MTFYEYMKRYRHRESPAGDLADDMAGHSKDFPASMNGADIMNYLVSKNACEGCIDAFIKCYTRYIGYTLRQQKKELYSDI